jgi:hypothetical protein
MRNHGLKLRFGFGAKCNHPLGVGVLSYAQSQLARNVGHWRAAHHLDGTYVFSSDDLTLLNHFDLFVQVTS